MKKSICAFMVIWIGFGLVAYGGTMAYFGGFDRDYRSNTGISAVMGIMGPAGLLISIFGTNFYQRGFCYTPACPVTKGDR